MSEQHNCNDGGLVPAGRRDLAPVAGPNRLVSRGIADLSKEPPESTASPTVAMTPTRALLQLLVWRRLRKRLRSLSESRLPDESPSSHHGIEPLLKTIAAELQRRGQWDGIEVLHHLKLLSLKHQVENPQAEGSDLLRVLGERLDREIVCAREELRRASE